MNLSFFLFFILGTVGQISLSELLKEPSKWEEEEVYVKGFLHPNQRGEYYLSLESALPSCCVGSLEKGDQQVSVQLEKPFSSSSPVTLKGVFKIEEGRYKLVQATVVQETRQWPYLSLSLIGLLLLIGSFVFRKK